MGEKQRVLDYSRPEKPREVLPWGGRIACGIVALPFTWLATVAIAVAIKDWHGLTRRGLVIGCVSLPVCLVMWWLAGVRVRIWSDRGDEK